MNIVRLTDIPIFTYTKIKSELLYTNLNSYT